jgi:A/G-specific adenine glycosylase
LRIVMGIEKELPKKLSKKPRRIEEKTVLLVQQGDKLLLHRREAKGLLAGLWELPNTDGILSEKDVAELLREHRLRIIQLKALPKAKHIFSHIEWLMVGYLAVVDFDGDKQRTRVETDWSEVKELSTSNI